MAGLKETPYIALVLITVVTTIHAFTIGPISDNCPDGSGVLKTPIDDIDEFIETCNRFDNWETVTGFFVMWAFGSSPCAFVRYLWPVTWLKRIFYFLLAWLIPDPTPLPGNNCRIREEDKACAFLGLGFIFLFLIVVLLYVIAWIASRPLRHWIIKVLYLREMWHAFWHWFKSHILFPKHRHRNHPSYTDLVQKQK